MLEFQLNVIVLKIMGEYMFYTYIIRCEDNTLYTGITTDPKRRFREHFSKSKECAKYTFRHGVVKMEALWSSPDRSSASRLEYQIKKLTKICKEALINEPENLSLYFEEKIKDEYKTELEIVKKINKSNIVKL